MPKAKTCFVVIGFGIKPDLATGRQIDLDKTYENLIKPTMSGLGYQCFRSKDISNSGVIDVPMYEWIYKADIVIADISTLNPNALYELGVRHALRPYRTIVISESQLTYPFDINHTMIDSYEHLGRDIGVSEANRFKKHLASKVKSLLKSKRTDSPVYTYLPRLKPPTFSKKEIRKISRANKNKPSIAILIKDGDDLRNKGKYREAILSYDAALMYDSNNSTLIQKKCLATYKSEYPNKEKSLKTALKIINKLNPDTTMDTETLGLTGAIFKRLYDISGKIDFLTKSMTYYEKGFVINNDYYNGTNLAYMHLLKASKGTKKQEIIADSINARRIYQKVISICESILKDKKSNGRTDLLWVNQSLAQAYVAIRDNRSSQKYIKASIKMSQGPFDKNTFVEHNRKVKDLLKIIKNKCS